MLKITKIQQAKKRKRRINIFINDEYAFSCSLNFVADNGLHQGMEFDENELESLKSRVYTEDNRQYLLNILSGKQYTESAIREKLRLRKVPSGIQDELIEYVRKLELIDDEKFINEYTDYLLSQNKYSAAQIKQKLMMKKFPPEMIDRMSSILREADSKEAIKKIVEKKMKKGAERESVIRYLLSKGFIWDDIREVLNYENKEEQ